MQRIAIKICGLSTPDTVDAAVKHGASHVGFVIFPQSPRHVGFGRLSSLASRVPDHVRKVAVLVDPDDALLDQIAASGMIDILQFHGKETPQRIASIRPRFGLESWKALSVKTAADLGKDADYKQSADFILFDAKTPEGASLPGGMGVRFDWTLLHAYRPVLPWGLSGGLDPDSVREAVTITKTTLVDVSSGVESAPGIKDVDKIAAFCKAITLL